MLLNKFGISSFFFADVNWKIAPILSAKSLAKLVSTFCSSYKSVLFPTNAKTCVTLQLFFISSFQKFCKTSLYNDVISYIKIITLVSL